MSVEIIITHELDVLFQSYKDSVVEYTPRVQNLLRIMNENFPLEMWCEVCKHLPGKDVPKFLWDITSFRRMWCEIHIVDELIIHGKQLVVLIYEKENKHLGLIQIYSVFMNEYFLERQELFNKDRYHKWFRYSISGKLMEENNYINGEKHNVCLLHGKLYKFNKHFRMLKYNEA